MLGTDEIRLGIYSNRAFEIIDALIAAYWRSSKSYRAKCTIKCMKIEAAPNGEIVLKLDRDQPVYIFQRSVWNELNDAGDARRQLVKMLKYVVSHKLIDACVDALGFTVERRGDGTLVAASDEFKTLCDLIARRRPRNRECAKALIDEPLDEVEAGLVAAKRDEIAKIKAETDDLLKKTERDSQARANRLTKEFDEKILALCRLKANELSRLKSELDADYMKIRELQTARVEEIEKKYA